MGKWIMEMIFSLGYPAIILLMLLENIFPPIPSELIMPLAGYMVTQGQFSFVGIIIAGTVGSVVGALPLYYLGRRVEPERIKQLADRHGCWLTISSDEIDRAQRLFDRHGGLAVLLCHLLPGVRSLISLPAGIHNMPLAAFLLYTLLGAGLWNSLLAGLGYLLGNNFQQIGEYLDPITYLVLGAILAIYLARLIKGLRHRSANSACSSS